MARLRDPGRRLPLGPRAGLSRASRPTRSRRPTRSPTRSSAAICDDLEGELGDLLLQVVYHAQMAKEAGRFDFEAVAARIADKMIRRHPHVFGDRRGRRAPRRRPPPGRTPRRPSARRKRRAAMRSILADLPLGLPALTRAAKLQRRAARVGFDWPEIAPVLAKLEEEIAEVRAELAAGASHERLERRGRRPAVRRGQPRPPSRRRRRERRCARPTRSSSAASGAIEDGAARRRPPTRGRLARRDGRALAARQVAGVTLPTQIAKGPSPKGRPRCRSSRSGSD